jgi:hypothetical protein
LGVHSRQLRVVVEHLLEVGDQPLVVGGVAGEPAAHVVADPTLGDPIQRGPKNLGFVFLEISVGKARRQEAMGWKLGRPGESSPDRIQGQDLFRKSVGHRVHGRKRRAFLRVSRQLLGEVLPVFTDSGAFAAESVADSVHHLQPGRHPASLRRWEVGAPERDPLGGREHVQGPAAAAVQTLHVLHVQRVHIGSFLAVDLDADQAGVHVRGGVGVRKGFVLHDVAPMAGRVPDRHQHRHLAAGGLGEGLVAPRPPVHGIGGVLQKVRGQLGSQAMG